MRRLMVSTAFVVALAAFGLACNTGVSTPTSVVVPTNTTISAITVNGPTPGVGTTAQFTATATFADGTTRDVTSIATWQTTNPQEAIVSTTGVVTAVSAGSVTVTATYQNVTGSSQISITG